MGYLVAVTPIETDRDAGLRLRLCWTTAMSEESMTGGVTFVQVCITASLMSELVHHAPFAPLCESWKEC